MKRRLIVVSCMVGLCAIAMATYYLWTRNRGHAIAVLYHKGVTTENVELVEKRLEESPSFRDMLDNVSHPMVMFIANSNRTADKLIFVTAGNADETTEHFSRYCTYTFHMADGKLEYCTREMADSTNEAKKSGYAKEWKLRWGNPIGDSQ